MRSLRSSRSALVALAGSTLLLVAQVAPIHAASGQDMRTIAQAYGDLSVFVLDVAAGYDGRLYRTTGVDCRLAQRLSVSLAQCERALANAFAQQLLTVYPSLSPDDQQDLAQLPQVRATVRQVWPTLSAQDRAAVRDQLADMVQATLPSMPCDTYDGLARATLLPAGPYQETNVDHLVQCWIAYPELHTGTPSAGASQDVAVRILSDVSNSAHVGTMSIINAMGN